MVRAFDERGVDAVSLSRFGEAFAGRGVRGDVRRHGLGLDPAKADDLRDSVTQVVSCFGPVEWNSGPRAASELHQGGTRAVMGFAESCPSLERFVHLSSILTLGHGVGGGGAQRHLGRRVALAPGQVATAALAQLPQAHEPARGGLPGVAQELLVPGRERHLIRRSAQVGQEDLLGLVVEDRRLHRPVEELVGVAARELVKRIAPGHEEGQPGLAPPGAAPHLAQAGHRPGKRHADGGVQLADVDPQLQRVGGHHGQQLAGHEPVPDLAPLGRRVAGAVGSHQLGQVGAPALLEPVAGEALDQLDPLA